VKEKVVAILTISVRSKKHLMVSVLILWIVLERGFVMRDIAQVKAFVYEEIKKFYTKLARIMKNC